MDMVSTPMAKRVLLIAAVLGLMVAGFAGRAAAAEPEAIYFNGKIVTLDAAGSTAGAVAVQDGKILKVGERRRDQEAGGALDPAGRPGRQDRRARVDRRPLPPHGSHDDEGDLG